MGAIVARHVAFSVMGGGGCLTVEVSCKTRPRLEVDAIELRDIM